MFGEACAGLAGGVQEEGHVDVGVPFALVMGRRAEVVDDGVVSVGKIVEIGAEAV